MPKALSKRDVDILEERGLWEAHSYLHHIIKRLLRKNLPIEIRYIKEAHKRTFMVARQPEMAGRYRRDNSQELRRIDGSFLKITDWKNIPNELAELDYELRDETKNLKPPITEGEYKHIICVAAKLSHRLACIHPFINGNGRASRLLIDSILMRAGLPSVAVKKIKPQYLRAMLQADDGDLTRLENIIIDSLEENKTKVYKIVLRKKAEYRKSRRRAGKGLKRK
jgi:Fic family protein